MNGKRLTAAGFACLGTLLQASCSQPLDLCADAAGPCLTVQVSADTTDPVDLLRALYTVGPDGQKETQFKSPAGGSPLPAGFALALTSSGAVSLDIIAERSLRPTLHGSAQLTLGANEHQQVSVTLTPDLSNLPYFGPPPRHHAGMVYFPPRKAVVLYGGISSDGNFLEDTWELNVDSNTWSQHRGKDPGPSARAANLAYDLMQQRLVVAGGADAKGAAGPDLWYYDAQGSWTQALSNSGGGSRVGAGLAVTDAGVMIVAGGVDPTGPVILQDVQTYDPNNLKSGPDFVARLTLPALPQIKTPKLLSISTPAAGNAVYLLGADESTASNLGIWQIKGLFSAPTASLSVTPVAADDPAAPSRRTDFAVVADSAAGLIYLSGGAAPTGEPLQDAYVFNLNTLQWTQVSAPVLPTARAGAQLALLPTAVLLFGGKALAGSAAPIALDTWTLTTGPFATPQLPGMFVRRP